MVERHAHDCTVNAWQKATKSVIARQKLTKKKTRKKKTKDIDKAPGPKLKAVYWDVYVLGHSCTPRPHPSLTAG